MISIDPNSIQTKDLHQYLVGTVAPRPIAFVSTLDEKGNRNLAPYSFFNVFSSNPPILVFSSNRRVNDNTTKDTLENVLKTKELVINVVSYSFVRKMAITSIQYDKQVDEFTKAGLSPVDSITVAAPRVKESPVHFECKVNEVLPLGEKGGAGHLVICQVKMIHLSEDILDEKQRISPHKIDLMGRMGRAFYVRASGESIYRIYQPTNEIGIGFDSLPLSAKQSHILSANDLGQLAGIVHMPSIESCETLRDYEEVKKILSSPNPEIGLHQFAHKELQKGNVELAAKLVWFADQINT